MNRLQSNGHTVATLMEPKLRHRLDAASGGYFAALHAGSVTEVIRYVRERPVNAVLLSPGCIGPGQLPGVAALVRGFPGIRTVAVVGPEVQRVTQRLLDLGASGVRRTIDVGNGEGWRQLRDMITDSSSLGFSRILQGVVAALDNPSNGVRSFFEYLVRNAPSLTTVRRICVHYDVRPSTLMSRFFRAGLPSPKQYLASIRLLYAACLLERRGLSISDAAYRLEYSSPQSFGRHVKALLGITAGEFRERMDLGSALADFEERMIAPYRSVFRTFEPLPTGVISGHPGRRTDRLSRSTLPSPRSSAGN